MADKRKFGQRTYNARSETVFEKHRELIDKLTVDLAGKSKTIISKLYDTIHLWLFLWNNEFKFILTLKVKLNLLKSNAST